MDRPLHVGIVCYASVGGSGVVATELASSLARRGHEVHVLSSEIPFRLRDARGPVIVHAIDTPAYPLAARTDGPSPTGLPESSQS